MVNYYYQVIGIAGGKEYKLGYTSNKWTWIRHANGWKKENLKFIKIYRKPYEN